ncbi:MAG: methyltransferase domain-containing protein [Clostridia bacterium]|nr:methyltransferase domain-containing protein [Clostridia bacterium]
MDLKARSLEMREFFDRKTQGYDDVHAKFLETKKLLTQSLPDHTKKVLDLGAGTGLELIALFERFPDARVTVVDISEGMLLALKEREFADRIEFICGDFFEVDLGSGYDAMISTSALHHFTLEDKSRLYKKVYDSLNEGGLFINCDKTALDQSAEDRSFKTYNENKHLDPPPHIDTPLTIEHETQALETAGFTDINISDGKYPEYFLYTAKKQA